MASVTSKPYAATRKARRVPSPASAATGGGRTIHAADDGSEVVERDGALVCTCPSSNKAGWCSHVQNVVQRGIDAQPSGSLHADFVLIPSKIIVPVFPSKGFFQEVWLDSVEADGSRKVAFSFDPTAKGVTLGWLFPGECRNVVRNMLLEWLKGLYLTVSTCTSTIHKNQKWSKADKREDDIESRDLVDLWCLLVHSECYACHSFSDFNSDAPEL